MRNARFCPIDWALASSFIPPRVFRDGEVHLGLDAVIPAQEAILLINQVVKFKGNIRFKSSMVVDADNSIFSAAGCRSSKKCFSKYLEEKAKP